MNPTFQKNMNLYPGLGLPGQVASQNPVVYALGNPQSDGPVTAGLFAWLSANGAQNTGTDVPLGLVMTQLTYANNNMLEGASMRVSTGQPLTIGVRGDFYVTTATAATVGQKVFAELSTGTVKTDAAGATVAGAVETDFVVKTAGGASSLITISNW